MRLEFVSKLTQQRLTVCQDELNIYRGEDRFPLSDEKVRDFIWAVCRAHPNVAQYSEILGGDSDVVQKVRFNAQVFLKNKLAVDDLIENVRGKGYRVSEKWNLVKEPGEFNLNSALMDKMKGIVDEAIHLSRTRALVTDECGISFIKLSAREANERFLSINELYWNLLEDLSASSQGAAILSIRQSLFELMTYVLFWRLGDRISEQQWRSDYEQEIRVLSRRIEISYIDMFDR